MRRITALVTALSMLATPTLAQDKPGHVVQFAAPVKDGPHIVHDLLWKCAGRLCAAATGNSRPVIVCMAMAREIGPVAAFVTDGAPLKDAELARCNAPRGKQQLASTP